jgi:hypothetical protein
VRRSQLREERINSFPARVTGGRDSSAGGGPGHSNRG